MVGVGGRHVPALFLRVIFLYFVSVDFLLFSLSASSGIWNCYVKYVEQEATLSYNSFFIVPISFCWRSWRTYLRFILVCVIFCICCLSPFVFSR